MWHQFHLFFLGHTIESDGTGLRTGWVKPRPFALRRVQMQTKLWASRLKQVPHFLEELNVTNNMCVCVCVLCERVRVHSTIAHAQHNLALCFLPFSFSIFL